MEHTTAPRAGALSHIRVLDLSRVFAGPWAGQMLADLGAEVIKVERPREGDDSRRLGPPFLRDDDGEYTRESGFYLSANRNKKSVTVDISRPEGQEIIRALAQSCDVLIENYKVGDLARYGLDYESLRPANPRLVYCSITGFGQTGPYRKKPGYDSIFQGMGGLMAITGHPDDQPGGGPQKVGLIVSDLMAGMYASVAILAALEHRDAVSGAGQYIDLALLDAQVAALSHSAMGYLVAGDRVPRCGTQSPTAAPSQMYRCQDGAIMIVVGNKAQWEKFCGALGRPDLPGDARFVTNQDRIRHRAELNAILEPIFLSQPRQHWVDALAEVGVPCGPVNELHEVFEDPQVRSREMVVHMPHPHRTSMPMLANPIRLSGTPVQYRLAPPGLGEHTDEVLAGLAGFDAARLQALRDEGVI
ncbi:MAG TPA: CaiB/BaiF CoA-transferase family protein [Ramlibacter sp.]|uniref:CaiB/BaiF CoA transferase family protein n=1 Tax=Ramlibacter sp. TaxID=1917967 RepID=UPI002D80AE4D|nr:CaiB/BaiF CoA-transferase family protein [Ramlibacter sp.]HET8747946.1 CaiB/BaiF CoA-transferase family protein [Ramlibacter sp.]